MEPETLVLNLGAQAAAALAAGALAAGALTVLTAIRCRLTATARTQTAARPNIERFAGGRLRGDMKQCRLPANGRQD